ncbi:RNA polymerase sigma factor [Paenibacillus cisolokensis]|uniref:RNA polymerase sigma factor n=1 Tax=Paenibacillus cisolokensis TaxID=1658519 RepID=UPI003D2E24E1
MKKSLLTTNKDFVEIKSSDHAESKIAEIYNRHVDTVYRVCFSMTGNKQDAEDVTQTVFIKLLESSKSFVDAEHEKAWLITAAQNRCRDLHRKWWRKKVVDLDVHAIMGTDTDILQHRDVEENLRKLPSMSRLILYLHYYEGYKLAEIANMLKLNLNTVKTKIRNARKRLKLEIGDDVYE